MKPSQKAQETAQEVQKIGQALEALDLALTRIRRSCDQLEAVQEIEASEFQRDAETTIEKVVVLRESITSLGIVLRGDPPRWASRAALDDELESLRIRAEELAAFEGTSERLRELARRLSRGQVEHRIARTRGYYENLRKEACEELLAIADSENCPALPGPEDPEEWASWAMENSDELSSAGFAVLADFCGTVLLDNFIFAAGPPEESEPEGENVDPLVDPVAEDPVPVPEVEDPAPMLVSTEADPTDAAIGEALPQEPHVHGVHYVPEPIEVPVQLAGSGELTMNVSVALEKDDPAPPLPDPPASEAPAPGELTEGQGCAEKAETGRVRVDEAPSLLDSPAPAPRREPARKLMSEIPENLRLFAAFRESHWISPAGDCEEAPWRSPAFAAKLPEAIVNSLAADPPRFGCAFLFSRAGERLSVEDVPGPSEISAFADLWSRGASALSALEERTKLDLAESVTNGSVRNSFQWRLRTLWEAMRPVSDPRLTSYVWKPLIDEAGIHSKLFKRVLEHLFLIGETGLDPVATVRHRVVEMLDGDSESREELSKKLESKRLELSQFVKKYWSACSGKIERTHCRNAWSHFMEEVSPNLKKLYPEANGGSRRWDVREMAAWSTALPEVHKRIADAAGASLKDRRIMDRTADRLREQVSEINRLHERLLESMAHTQSHWTQEAWEPEDFHLILGQQSPPGDEGLLQQLLCRVLTSKDEPSNGDDDPLLIDARILAAAPDILRSVKSLDGTSIASMGISPLDIGDPVYAAAVLMGSEEDEMDGSPSDRLASALKAPHRRFLQSRIPGLLSEAEAKKLSREEIEIGEGLCGRLEGYRTVLGLAGAIATDSLRAVLEEARGIVGNGAQLARDPHLVHEWLSRVAVVGDEFVREIKDGLSKSAESRATPVREAVQHALDAGRLGDAVRLLASEEHPPDESTRFRETLWRADAEKNFGDPLSAWKALEKEALFRDLLTRWSKGIQLREPLARSLRDTFTSSILGRQGVPLLPGPEVTRISCQALREWISREKLNPSCVPQLSAFGEIVLVVPKVLPDSREAAQNCARLAAKVREKPSALPVLLTPRYSQRVRQDILREFASRKLPAALVDDIDLCRILNPEGAAPNSVLAFLEIVLEQLPLSFASPFQSSEGQNVQMEMYFGRRDEARDLAETSKYSRLFSGRKLGKSALLRFVEATYDNRKLPSGNTLRVVYVSAVGIDSDTGLVRRIAETVAKRLHWQDKAAATATADNAGDRLAGLLRNYIKQNERVSLLLVLDEADVFLEQQLASYASQREKCLSFRMRSQIEADKDAQGLPRVRFVFAGYRVANTHEGAWANWGEVLRLTPLAPDDASHLIAGPLGRMGVECGRQASAIAHRCGYQPAVLLRFGERLLYLLEKRSPSAGRALRLLEVSDEDVVHTFEDPVVQEEIRIVVRNNFQGSPKGEIVFGCLLGEFMRHAPGASLENATETVIANLRDLSDGDLRWLATEPSGVWDEVNRILHDLADRHILGEARTAPGHDAALLMRFPHHLSVLAPLAARDTLKTKIRGLAQESSGRSAVQGARNLFSSYQLQSLRSEGASIAGGGGFRSVSLVGSHWPEAILHTAVGLPDRLGFDSDRILMAQEPGVAGLLSKTRRRCLVTGACPLDVESLVSTLESGRPCPLFVGGVDLLRWSIRKGGSDLRVSSGEPALLDGPMSLGRLSRNTLSWWFESVRGLIFHSPAAMEMVHLRTSGIPVLVREMDRVLLGDGEEVGVNLSESDFNRRIEQFDKRLPEVGRRLSKGEPSFVLEAREGEILRMVALATKEGATDLKEDLSGEMWDEFYRPQFDVPPVGPEDRTHLEVLMRIGLLPVAGNPSAEPLDRLTRVPQSDALLKLVGYLAS